MTDLALSIIIILSAAGGALIGIIVYLFLEDSYGKDRAAFHGKNGGHHRRAERGDEMLDKWGSGVILPEGSAGKLASDIYPRRD